MRAPALWSLIALSALSVQCGGRTPPDAGDKNPADPNQQPNLNPPRIQLNGTVPMMDEQNVPLDSNLLFEFSDPMQPETVTFVTEPEHALGAPDWSKGNLLATIAPINPFVAGTTYRVTVTGLGHDGRALGGIRSLTFTTASATSLGPSILNTFPTNGDSRVALDSAISVRFARTMDTIDVRLAVSPFVDLGLPAWSEGDRKLSFPTPLSELRPNTRYVVSISGADLSGAVLPADTGFSFMTVDVPDTVKPVVTGGSPNVGTSAVPTNAMISLSFSEPMNQTLVESAFSLSPPVPCAFTWVNNTVTCRPTSQLLPNTQYQANVAVTASDSAGNTLGGPHAVPFTTAAGADNNPPFVDAVLPAVNAVGAAPNQSITLTFSEPVQKATAQAAFSITSPSAINGTFNWNGTNDAVTFAPSMRFPFATEVSWRVSILAKDLAGNAVAAPITGKFRTRDCVMTGPILARYNALGGINSALGNCRTDEQAAPDGKGKYNHFRAGSIYWSQATGAHEVRGEIRKKWAVLGWELSALGYPTTDELTTPDGVGRYNHFQIGSIYWTPSTGAYEVRGLIRELWASTGYEKGVLGYPTTDESDTADKTGRYNHFQNGSIYYTPATGTHYVYGAIRTRWAQLGYEKSSLGYPISDVTPVTGGLESQFQGGRIFWNTADGTTTLR